MSLPDALARGRAAFEARMRGTCSIDRPTGQTTSDDDGKVTPVTVNVYEGKCYTRYPGLAFETNHESAGVQVVDSRIVVRIPFGTKHRPGDVVTILTDPDNPQLIGCVYRVASIDDQSQATAQRLLCVDYQAGVS